jgi:hypothetical protein
MILKRESISFAPESPITLPAFYCVRCVTLVFSVHR